MGFETGLKISRAFPNAEIYHVYGLTEACPRVAYLPPYMFERYADCVGVPLASVELKIICKDGSMAENGEIGCLYIKGGNIMSGYYRNEEKTREVLKDGWLCTNDLACFNEKGLLRIMGRADDLIIKAGMNIYPKEIENALGCDPRVKELYVYGYESEGYSTQIALDISGDFSDAAEVKALCLKCLPAYQIPTDINLVDELEKNISGKIIRRKNYAGV